MDERAFDAMLRTALEEALREDLKDLETGLPVCQSLRQRRRMRRMLADPWGYERQAGAAEAPEEMPETPPQTPRQRRRPGRWLLVAVVAALLAGTAAGYSLRGGETLKQLLERSIWAEEYGGAANTDLLLEMGGGNIGSVVDDGHIRMEVLDAVSDGETAMVLVRLTVLDMDPLEEAFGSRQLVSGNILEYSGSFFETGSYGANYTYPENDDTLAENQQLMLFYTEKNEAAQDQRLTLCFRDFGYTQSTDPDDPNAPWEDIVLIPGEWTLQVELSFDRGLELDLDQTIQLEDCAFTVYQIRLSALAAYVDIRHFFEDTRSIVMALQDTVFRMRDGTEVVIGASGGGVSEDGDYVLDEMIFRFQMPVDIEDVYSIVVQGQEIVLDGLAAPADPG